MESPLISRWSHLESSPLVLSAETLSLNRVGDRFQMDISLGGNAIELAVDGVKDYKSEYNTTQKMLPIGQELLSS